MSRSVIRDIVIPIVARIMQENGYLRPTRPFGMRHGFVIRDQHLEDFLEEELKQRFGVIGASECQHLREQLEEARKNDPYSFEFLLRSLVEKYLKLQTKIRDAKKTRLEGPPDRFSELRKKYLHYSQQR